MAIIPRQEIQAHATMVPPAPPQPREVTMSDLTPSQSRELELANWRVETIRSLRQLADILASTTRDQFPTPDVSVSNWSVEVPTDDDIYNCIPVTPEIVRAAMAAKPGGWSKYAATDYTSYSYAVGQAIRVRFQVNRSTTCRKVQVGTKTVEAVPEHEEPIYEWQCDTPEVEV